MKIHMHLFNIPQLRRDATSFVLFIAALTYFIVHVINYVSGIQRPLLMTLSFAGSLALALLHDWRPSGFRFFLIRAARTSIVFAFGILAAHILRGIYVEIREALADIPEAIQYFGSDAYSVLINRLVGYGGCFAIGLLATRWLFGNAVEKFLFRALVLPTNRPSTCETCHQTLP